MTAKCWTSEFNTLTVGCVNVDKAMISNIRNKARTKSIHHIAKFLERFHKKKWKMF